MTKLPTCSIIMPAYNAAHYIKESIVSAQQQTYKNWELIIVDDGSTDSTSEIVTEFQKNDDRIVYFYQENKKLPAARNSGIKLSKGALITFLDADDLWLPEKLEMQLKLLETHNVDLVFSSGYILKQETMELITYPTPEGFFSGEQMYRMEFEHNHIPVVSVLLKREWIDHIGYQDETLVFGCEDWDYWLRMARNKATFYGMPEKLFKYRVHQGGMSQKIPLMVLAAFTTLYKNADFQLLPREQVIKKLKAMVEKNVPELLNMNRRKEATEEILKILKLSFTFRYLLALIIIKLRNEYLYTLIGYCFYPGLLLVSLKKRIAI